jgi:hypothetical protein
MYNIDARIVRSVQNAKVVLSRIDESGSVVKFINHTMQ